MGPAPADNYRVGYPMNASSLSSRRRRPQPNRFQLPLFVDAMVPEAEARQEPLVLDVFDEERTCDRIRALQREITQSRDSMFLDRPSTGQAYEEQADRNWALAVEYRRVWKTTNALGLGDRIVELIRERDERKPSLVIPQKL